MKTLFIIFLVTFSVPHSCLGFLDSYTRIQKLPIIRRNVYHPYTTCQLGTCYFHSTLFQSSIESMDIYDDGIDNYSKDYSNTLEQDQVDYTPFKNQNSDDISIMDDLSNFPQGIPHGFVIVKQYSLPIDGFHNFSITCPDITPDEVNRLKLGPHNVTLPVALMMLDPTEYPSFSRARKACRKGSILIHRGPLGWSEDTQTDSVFDLTKSIRGRVGDRILQGDVIAKQIRVGGGFYPSLECAKPPFELPVIYEDDHVAVVNKPAGILVYAHRSGGVGRMTIRSALPYVLKPPRRGTMSIMRRPATVHRLDKPTSGLLLVAKTKPAMVDLTRQFVERRIKKTYTAIVNGIPDTAVTLKLSSMEARSQGFDVDALDDDDWNMIDHPIDEKSATTLWRTLKYGHSLVAQDNTVTMVELKPKTGRFHQLRRHMAWVCNTPIVGDAEYDPNTSNLRERGLFLCANKICFDHPYFNTENGRNEWDRIGSDDKYAQGAVHVSKDDRVQVCVAISLPRKFSTFFTNEDQRGRILYIM